MHMAENSLRETKSAHRLAFDHYLRTGQRLTTAEWTARQERKFNPYHDEIGRFTSPPGVTVSWGRQTRPSGLRTDPERQARSINARSVEGPRKLPRSRPEPAVLASEPKENAAGYRSELVRTATSEAGNAETYFDLGLRQAGLDGL
jgi:hypothetical protein